MVRNFVTLDVFTDQRFAGNPLAVVLDGAGLSTDQMQRTAREFGYSETTFVLPGRKASGKIPIRIFTPAYEMPFAGHPTIGTAVALAMQSEMASLVFDEKAGPVPVSIKMSGRDLGWARFDAPKIPTRGAEADPVRVAQVLSLRPEQIVTGHGLPCQASCGAPFMIVELRDLPALEAIQFSRTAAHGLLDHGIYAFCRQTGDPEADLRCRMFSMDGNIGEDPATGSAASALAGALAIADGRDDLDLSWRILQGVEMGRPSRIDAFARCRGGGPITISIAGNAVSVMRGTIEIPD